MKPSARICPGNLLFPVAAARSIQRPSGAPLLSLWAGLLLLGLPPCTRSAEAPPGLNQHDVLPLFLRHCTACHGAQTPDAGLDLRSRAAMLRGGKSGPALVPGKAEESLIVRRVRSGDCPPNKKLVEANVKPIDPFGIARIADWIASGAIESPDQPDLSGTANDPLIKPKDREFWSFRPPTARKVPAVRRPEQLRNPIDAFIMEKLEGKNLSFSPEAPAATLVRRIYLDLTGLPPTPEEIQVFLTDRQPMAFDRLVDRLLESPRYGERWGRVWLDLAGYSDVEGKREQHLPRPNIHRYRDYVIRSFNADKGYDRFLLEQIAGDELADYEHASVITEEIYDNLVATGFLRMAPDPTWANITGFPPDRLDVMADAMDVFGSSVLGLTIKCARCHNHKFDPLPQRDYYRLVDLFKGVYDEYNWLKPGLQAYGGAANLGRLRERTLPYVTTSERQAWEARAKAAPEGKKPAEPGIAALWDRGDPSPTYLYKRGDYQRPGGLVKAGVPAVLMRPDERFDITPPWPGASKTGRRLALAKWLTRPDHPLTSRVIVNRIWKEHFGRGIVRTTENFGKTGTLPSHPELLDWLAIRFVQDGWRMKELHRVMVTSRTYRQSSELEETDSRLRLDPENVLLSRMPLKRLDAESLWDTAIYVAGAMVEQRFGPAVPVQTRPDGSVAPGRTGPGWRRSIYGEQVRKGLPTLLEAFDLPQMNPNCVSRAESIVATQALSMLNDPGMRDLAARFARRVAEEAGANAHSRVERAFLWAFARKPDGSEMAESLEILGKLSEPGANEAQPEQALARFCHTLMNSAEFLYVD